MVSCVKKVSASELGSGTYGHLGMSIQGDRPVFPDRIVPEPTFGTYSLRNVQGQEIVRRDLPMVTKTFSAETPNWGRGQMRFARPELLEMSMKNLAEVGKVSSYDKHDAVGEGRQWGRSLCSEFLLSICPRAGQQRRYFQNQVPVERHTSDKSEYAYGARLGGES